MKIAHLLGLVGLGVLLPACSDETPSGSTNVTAEDEVLFTVNTASVDSRTMYGDENADGTAQGLYWGNYNNWVADSIKIFSPHTRFGSANYLITPNTVNSNTAADVTRLGEYGLQWGSNPDNLENFEFYAFYPASRCDDDVTYSDKTAGGSAVVDAWIRPGQSPVSFTTSTSGGTTTYLGNPDMRACLMTAHTSAKYGAEAVGFQFKPLATVLDVTIQGPQNANMQPENIYTVSLEHIKGEAIVGNFKVDLSTNTMVQTSITNGESQISMQPRITEYGTDHKPTSTTMVQLGRNTVMKVRFFLIPRSDIQISDLRLTVTTKDHQYIKTLTPADVASTATALAASSIRKVKLPYMDAANGRTFNVNFWLSELDPDIYVTELSIPGAYNAASSVVTDAAKKFQSVVAQEQFKAGVRAFGLSIFDEYKFNSATNPTQVTDSTLCYGNSATRNQTQLNTTDATINVGTVSDLFKKLNTWLNEEKANWNEQNPGKDFNDFVVLCLAPNRYYNGNASTNRFQHSYQIANSLKAEIIKFNESYPGAIFTGPITPNTTVADVAGKIIIHYNASSDKLTGTTITGAPSDVDTSTTVNGVDALFSFWNAPESKESEYWSRPQLVNMAWGAPPAVTTPQESISAASLGWLFYEFNGVGTANNYVTAEQFESGITNYGIASYDNYIKKEHNIWGLLQIGGQYLGKTGQAQCTEMANVFNTFTYNYIASGQRIAAPWGIIMMNYADATSKEAIAAKSPELIRAIIANNRLFPLQRKGDNPTPTSLKNGGPIVKVGEWDQNK